MAGLEVTARPDAVGLSEARLERVRDWMARQVAEDILPGLAVAVARRGEIAFAAHTGLMDVEAAKPLRPDTIFRIYSMTKPIVCAAAMMLYEEGRFQLDDPIADFMPEFGDMQVALADGSGGVDYVAAKRPISVRDLMRHTSGLVYADSAGPPFSDRYKELGVEFNFTDSDLTLAEVVGRAARVPLACHPGEQWNYGISTDVLGRLLELPV